MTEQPGASTGGPSTGAAGTIVVGVDGSDDARRAIDWALAAAKLAGMALLFVHGVEVGMAAASPFGTGQVYDDLQQAGQAVVDAAVARAHAEGLVATGRLEVGSSAYALIEASRGAALLVVGSRGHGGFTGLLLGSVSTACVHHAHCPIVVVPPPDR
jgi:nucleotide-binding universal stress UspA family protein